MPLKQETRSLQIQTPLGPDQLLLVAIHGREEMSRLFQFELELISDNVAIAAADIVGKSVSVSIRKEGNEVARHFHGFVSRFSAGDEDGQGRRNYRAEVVPWLWFLTRTTDCRIFQNMTVVEIIEQIFGDLGFRDFDRSQVKGHHPKREYCVQYRETDFNFVSRLMEEEGIFFYFKHEQAKHTLIMADHKGAYGECSEKEVDFPRDIGSRAMEDHITSWEHQYAFRTGKWAQTDYNFETPSQSLMTNEKTVVKLPGADKYENYDYPGEYPTTSDGRPLTKTRMEEDEVPHDLVQGESSCRTFFAGGKFKVRQHKSRSEEGKSFVLLAVEHSASEPLAYETGSGGGRDYRNSFSCFPDSVTFRPERISRRPFVQGMQTAMVVGPPGETIYPDKYGRVKVQFYWDREGKKDDKSSCWIRVSQNWAGQTWGGMFIPHVGQEVIVAFLEGDPDRPIIVGRVYNAEQMPPLDLPAQKKQCIILDEYGNKIMMDSGVGTISVVCPTHNSEIHLGKSIELLTDSNLRKRIKANLDAKILGQSIWDVAGNVRVRGGADLFEFFVGAQNNTLLGYRSQITGGRKSELVVGSSNSTIRGSKTEIINGPSFKIHKGVEYKNDGSDENKRAANLKELVQLCKQIRAAEKTLVKADRKIKAAGKAELKASAIKEQAQLIEEDATNFKVMAKAAAKIKAASATLEAQGQLKTKAASIKEEAQGVIKASASLLKLG